MILARPITLDRDDDLEPAWERLGLAPAARQLLLETVGRAQLLVTGLGPAESRFLREVDDPRLTCLLSDPERRPGGASVSGTRAGIDALARLAEGRGLVELARALDVAIATDVPPDATTLGGRTFRWGERTHVMGVVNVTPDSFSDGGRHLEREAAVRQGQALAEAGADLIDIGGESTRPGAGVVPAQVELERVLPVIEALRATIEVPLSIDTRKAEVAAQALRAGAVLVNDVSGLGHDPGLAGAVADAGAALVLMHIQGTPETMQVDP
ncbi:MAG: dihydropteroate synthase, partial [Myxococcaceae bacterium]